jgi:hypothetical protein
VLCCAVLCCAVLCCAVLCCAVLCCAVLCCAQAVWRHPWWRQGERQAAAAARADTQGGRAVHRCTGGRVWPASTAGRVLLGCVLRPKRGPISECTHVAMIAHDTCCVTHTCRLLPSPQAGAWPLRSLQLRGWQWAGRRWRRRGCRWVGVLHSGCTQVPFQSPASLPLLRTPAPPPFTLHTHIHGLPARPPPPRAPTHPPAHAPLRSRAVRCASSRRRAACSCCCRWTSLSRAAWTMTAAAAPCRSRWAAAARRRRACLRVSGAGQQRRRSGNAAAARWRWLNLMPRCVLCVRVVCALLGHTPRALQAALAWTSARTRPGRLARRCAAVRRSSGTDPWAGSRCRGLRQARRPWPGPWVRQRPQASPQWWEVRGIGVGGQVVSALQLAVTAGGVRARP